jgi:glutamine cyclotransferase
MKKNLLSLSFLILSLMLYSCGGESENPVDEGEMIEAQILSPSNQQQFNAGNEISVSIKVNNTEVSELAVYVEDTLYQDGLPSEDNSVKINTKNSRVGEIRIRLSYKNSKGEEKSDSRTVVLFSDIQPEYKTATIVNEYPHDKTSYTQGLEFYKGFLFEGTGQKGKSILAEVDLNTGDIQRKIDLDPTLFGEGITILNDTVYQLTYLSNKCMVYDINFNPITEFTYTGEGWGLCNDGSQLLMSNGSSEIVWRDPSTFKVTKRIQVFEPNKEVVNLNELELVDGNLYANIYTEKKIVEIDTATGKVLSYIDCNALITDLVDYPGKDVMNGIAYNPLTQKLYLTGKWWPKLYEVSVE